MSKPKAPAMSAQHGNRIIDPLDLVAHIKASGPKPPLMASTTKPDVAATLAERGTRYGTFAEQARISQNLKAAMVDSPNWASLRPDQKEALEMNAHKTARILNGDPDYHDSWHDIMGYTKLVADTLEVAK